jgi:hypothetical protein
MRSFALGLVATLALAVGLQDAGATPSLRNSDSVTHVSQSLVVANPAALMFTHFIGCRLIRWTWERAPLRAGTAP